MSDENADQDREAMFTEIDGAKKVKAKAKAKPKTKPATKASSKKEEQHHQTKRAKGAGFKRLESDIKKTKKFVQSAYNNHRSTHGFGIVTVALTQELIDTLVNDAANARLADKEGEPHGAILRAHVTGLLGQSPYITLFNGLTLRTGGDGDVCKWVSGCAADLLLTKDFSSLAPKKKREKKTGATQKKKTVAQ